MGFETGFELCLVARNDEMRYKATSAQDGQRELDVIWIIFDV